MNAVTAELVDLAVRALRVYGGDLTRDTAARLLPLWTYYADLSRPERAAVLDRFPTRRIEPGSSGPDG